MFVLIMSVCLFVGRNLLKLKLHSSPLFKRNLSIIFHVAVMFHRKGLNKTEIIPVFFFLSTYSQHFIHIYFPDLLPFMTLLPGLTILSFSPLYVGLSDTYTPKGKNNCLRCNFIIKIHKSKGNQLSSFIL